MVLTPHLLVGAAIVAKIKFLPLPLTLLLAFLSHYFLDSLPHSAYSIKNIQRKNWSKSLPDFLKVFLDIFLGFLLIFIFSKNFFLAGIGGFLAILPDGLIFLGLIFPNKLLKLYDSLKRKIHFPENQECENKKIPLFWGILSQVLVMLLAIYFLR